MKTIKDLFHKAVDPNWRLENLYQIINKNGQNVPFKPNYAQKLINSSLAKRKLVLKSRQIGISTNELLKLLDYTMFTENATTCIIAHEQDAIKKLFRIVQRGYKFFPDAIKPRISRGGGSMYEMFFPEIQSRIYCDLEVRGDTISRLHVSEAAFMKDSAKLKATLQAVPLETGRVTIETTPNGMANYFFDLWNDPDTTYEKFFFPWYKLDEYKLSTREIIKPTEDEIQLINKAKNIYGVNITSEQLAFRRFKKSEMKSSSFDITKVSFEQEYPEDDKSCFLTSGDAVLDLFKINDMIAKATEPIEIKQGIKIYKQHEKDKFYVCAADPAEGIGKDYSAAVMLDPETFEIVAVLQAHIKPSEFAARLKTMCDMYKSPNQYPPLLAVERNNHGHTVLLELDHLGYSNIYHSDKDQRPGWRTDGISRPLMMDKLVEAIENDYLKIRDKAILGECLTLINNNGKIEAATGKHDDLIIACAIALQVKPESRFTHTEIESLIKL